MKFKSVASREGKEISVKHGCRQQTILEYNSIPELLIDNAIGIVQGLQGLDPVIVCIGFYTFYYSVYLHFDGSEIGITPIVR